MRDLARDLSLGGAQLALSVAAALTTVWVTGQNHDHIGAAPTRPTATASASSPAGVRRSPHPATSSSEPAVGGTLLAAGEPARTAGRETAEDTGGSTSPARPSPSPEPPAAEVPSTDVRVRLPLGVRPGVGLDLTIGGHR